MTSQDKQSERATPSMDPAAGQDLRKKAEARAWKEVERSLDNIERLSPDAIREIVHELHVHQIQLEMQNEELRRAQVELDAARRRYFDLYDMAPVGYCTLSAKGMILEANLTAATLLGRGRKELIDQPFSRFIFNEDQDVYYHLHRKQNDATSTPQVCELRLEKPDGTASWARLHSTADPDFEGMPGYLIVLSDITEQKRAEEALREEERYLRTILQATVDGFCVIGDGGKILQVNEAFCRMSGYTRDELLTLNISAVDTVEEPVEIAARIQRIIANGSEIFETRHRRKDGSIYFAEISVTYINTDSGKFVSFCRDITARKQTEKALYEREAQYRRIMVTAREGIGVTDKNWRMTFANNHLAELLGYEPTEMAGRPLADFSFTEDKIDAARRMRERQQGQDSVYDCRFRCKNGSEIWATVSATVQIDKDGKFAGSFFMLTDNTERKKAEASSKAKSDFLALVSHEIRTPLNALVGFSSLARKTSDPAVLQQYLDIIDQSSRSLMDLVNDILDMSKIEAGHLRLESVPFNLADTIDLLVWQYTPLATQNNLEFHVSREAGLPTWISGDPMRLRQLLANLLTNAIKFTDSGGVTLTLAAATTPSPEKDRLALRFEIQDTGIGIANDNLTLLFQPFWQIDPSITRKYGGTGLGLAIVQSLVKLMGGRIEVTSEEGRGSCFVVELPFQACAPPLYKKIATPVVAPLDILVVEDNAFSRQFLTDILTLWGHTATQAEDAFQALQLMEHHPYDLIILDVRMPGMDGIELTRRLRQREKEQKARPVPIIACTGDTEGITKERCLAAGMQTVLSKPLNPDKLALALTGQGYAPLAVNTDSTSCRRADRIIADMGLDAKRVEAYLQLLRDDIEGELNRLDQALLINDRKAFRDAAHTLKGLCGHLREKLPRALALRLHQEALTSSQENLHDTAILLRSICTQIFSEN